MSNQISLLFVAVHYQHHQQSKSATVLERRSEPSLSCVKAADGQYVICSSKPVGVEECLYHPSHLISSHLIWSHLSSWSDFIRKWVRYNWSQPRRTGSRHSGRPTAATNQMKQAASLTERNNRLAHSLTYRDPHFGLFWSLGLLWGVFSYYRCKIWRHILARRTQFLKRATKFRAYLA